MIADALQSAVAYIFSRLVQPLNIEEVFSTLDTTKLERLSSDSEVQPRNMLDIVVTLEVLNPERSSSVSDEQPSNMLSIDVTFRVFSADKLLIVVRFGQ